MCDCDQDTDAVKDDNNDDALCDAGCYGGCVVYYNGVGCTIHNCPNGKTAETCRCLDDSK